MARRVRLRLQARGSRHLGDFGRGGLVLSECLRGVDFRRLRSRNASCLDDCGFLGDGFWVCRRASDRLGAVASLGDRDRADDGLVAVGNGGRGVDFGGGEVRVACRCFRVWLGDGGDRFLGDGDGGWVTLRLDCADLRGDSLWDVDCDDFVGSRDGFARGRGPVGGQRAAGGRHWSGSGLGGRAGRAAITTW